MRTVTTTYKWGQEFLTDNEDILARYPLQTVFFEVNAKCITETSENNFLVKVQMDDKFLLIVHYADYPMVLFGDGVLCAEFAKYAVCNNLTFTKILGALDTCEAFLGEYEKLVHCTHEINHAMDIMRCDNVLTYNVDDVGAASDDDIAELTKLITDFAYEALGDKADAEKIEKDVTDRLHSFAVIRQDGKIVSLASTKRETSYLACIADVYTLPAYRNRGLSCRIVTYLTRRIVSSGRLAYLFVDKKNPVSNHLYTKIGYTYAVPQYEIKLTRKV